MKQSYKEQEKQRGGGPGRKGRLGRTAPRRFEVTDGAPLLESLRRAVVRGNPGAARLKELARKIKADFGLLKRELEKF